MSIQYRIFSCDGGGFRGYLTSLILEDLEQQLGLSLSKTFEMYAGTSTGSLIAAGLAYGLSAKDLREIYEIDGKNIFPPFSMSKEFRKRTALFLSSFWKKPLLDTSSFDRFAPSKPVFDGSELEKTVKRIFGEEKFGIFKERNKRVIAIAYDCWNSTPVIFNSDNPIYENLKIVDILMASSAYPGGFPSRNLSEPSFLEEWAKQPRCSTPKNKLLPLVDGGLAANNPALIALSEYLKKHPGEKQFILASFGTGKLLLRFASSNTEDMGMLDWAFPTGDPLLESVYGGYSKVSDLITKNLLESMNLAPDDVYFRFQPLIDIDPETPPLPKIVQLSEQERKQYEMATFQYTAKEILEKIARKYISSQSDRIAQLVTTLK